jgi:hypothetical protein
MAGGAFLLGVLRKTGVLTWCFGGVIVVFGVVSVVLEHTFFER